MLDDFSTELENTESRLDGVMKKMAKVTRMSNGEYLLSVILFICARIDDTSCIACTQGQIYVGVVASN